MASTYTDKNNPFSRCKNKHSQLETFSQPYFNKIFSNCLSQNSPAKRWPYRFRSRGTTGSSTLDHDFGHLCRGRRIQMSGHSDFGIFKNVGASSILPGYKQILHQLLLLPLLRGPILINIPFWVIWWVSVFNKSPYSLMLLHSMSSEVFDFHIWFSPGFLMQWRQAR